MLNDIRQSKYVIIDASHGGSDSGLVSNNIKEKDLTLDISMYIYDKLKNAGINVSLVRDSDVTITDSDRTNKILNTYGNNSNVILISNHVDSDDEAEVIYALRNNSTLANMIADKLSKTGLDVKEPFQRRLESDTAKDFYSIHRNTGNIQTVLVNYGNKNDFSDVLNNYRRYANAVADAIIAYLGGVVPSGANEYVVKAGDTLYGIARQFNTTVDNIKRLNNLSSNFLSIGQRLIVNENNESNSDNNLYVVKSGDNLYSIARKYNTTVDELKRLNNLSSNLLSIGQVLKIPVLNVSNNIDNNYIMYTVVKGDSLYGIANRYGVSVADIMKLNGLSSNLLSIGQVLKIPKSTNQVIYVVKSGDNLYSIARRYGTTVDEIKRLNNLSSNLLNIGDKLTIK